ncbi:uncharacterized protein [Physcomitrium patens]|uniref:uncharacterized protein n=1 Tax=Physcomitrium patens TaxID=3218 RepID=UPI003CCD48F8
MIVSMPASVGTTLRTGRAESGFGVCFQNNTRFRGCFCKLFNEFLSERNWLLKPMVCLVYHSPLRKMWHPGIQRCAPAGVADGAVEVVSSTVLRVMQLRTYLWIVEKA